MIHIIYQSHTPPHTHCPAVADHSITVSKREGQPWNGSHDTHHLSVLQPQHHTHCPAVADHSITVSKREGQPWNGSHDTHHLSVSHPLPTHTGQLKQTTASRSVREKGSHGTVAMIHIIYQFYTPSPTHTGRL